MIITHDIVKVVEQTISDWQVKMRSLGLNDQIDLQTFEVEHLKETISGILGANSLVFQWSPRTFNNEYLDRISKILFKKYIATISNYPEAYDTHSEQSPYKIHIPSNEGGAFIKLLYRNLIIELFNLGLLPSTNATMVVNFHRYHSNTMPWVVSEFIYSFIYEIEVNEIL